jgi:hypothetical protein
MAIGALLHGVFSLIHEEIDIKKPRASARGF